METGVTILKKSPLTSQRDERAVIGKRSLISTPSLQLFHNNVEPA